MALALLNVFDESIVQNIQDFLPADPDPLEDFETLFATNYIDQTEHYITNYATGWSQGGYVYFYKEREAGWYKWHCEWEQKPSYEKIEEGVVAIITDPDGSMRIGILPDNWEDLIEFDDELTVLIGDDGTMQARDAWND